MGPVSALINNASVFERDDALDATRASWDLHMEVNLRAPFVLIQEFVRQLPPGVDGNVINILDQRVWNLTPFFTSYTLSKAGLWTLTQTLAHGAGASCPGQRGGPRPDAAEPAADAGELPPAMAGVSRSPGRCSRRRSPRRSASFLTHRR